MTISVLITTYRGERADRLARSLESIYAQTVPADEVVLVLDGPIDAAQEKVIAAYEKDRRIPRTKVVGLAFNVGLGAALEAGQQHCSGDWIMRMDSDDISVPNRTEIQLAYLREHPEVDLIAGWAEEFFEEAPGTRLKTAPEQPDDLTRALRWRNIICHPSVMIRADMLRRVGGFRGRFPYLEDWDLFVRLALTGARMVVLPVPLVRVSTSLDQAARRGGWRYAINELRFHTYCWQSGFLRFHQYAVITPASLVFRLAGATIRNHLYRLVRISP
jgi:glycosyltransferase involved in cell wall biosynthesis